MKGTVHFAVDPGHRVNRGISDVKLASRDDDGLVHFTADFLILRPADLKAGNRTVLFEVVNRGKPGVLSMFDRAKAAADPARDGALGDAFLLKQGYTVAWLGWQHDVPGSPDLMRVHVPVARGVQGDLFAVSSRHPNLQQFCRWEMQGIVPTSPNRRSRFDYRSETVFMATESLFPRTGRRSRAIRQFG